MGICHSSKKKPLSENDNNPNQPTPSPKDEQHPPESTKVAFAQDNNHNGQADREQAKRKFQKAKSRSLQVVDQDLVDESFTIYYKNIKELLKKNNFDVNKIDHEHEFDHILATMLQISKKIAKKWIEAYIDYMIMITWNINLDKKIQTASPFPIQLVTRTHIVFNRHFAKFNKILLGKDSQIDYMPFKSVVVQSEEFFIEWHQTYGNTKAFLFQNLYRSSQVEEVVLTADEANRIWENPVMAQIRNEFSFNFMGNEHERSSNKIIRDHAGQIPLTEFSLESIVESSEIFREKLGIVELQDGNTTLPKLMDQFLKTPVGNKFLLAENLDAMPFDGEFINMLAYEQLISIADAMRWILEYKKFLFLHFANTDKDVIITPSTSVARVWFLHQSYTALYHDIQKQGINNCFPYFPTTHKQLTFKKNYQKTLDKYMQYFEKPSVEYWPSNFNIVTSPLGLWHSYLYPFGHKILSFYERRRAIKKFLRNQDLKGKSENFEMVSPYKKKQILEKSNFQFVFEMDDDALNLSFEILDTQENDSIEEADEDEEDDKVESQQAMKKFHSNELQAPGNIEKRGSESLSQRSLARIGGLRSKAQSQQGSKANVDQHDAQANGVNDTSLERNHLNEDMTFQPRDTNMTFQQRDTKQLKAPKKDGKGFGGAINGGDDHSEDFLVIEDDDPDHRQIKSNSPKSNVMSLKSLEQAMKNRI